MTSADDRLTALEIRAAEQERTIDELSGEIAAQWAQIDRLTKVVDLFSDRFDAIEAGPAIDTTVQKPPHW